MRKKVFRSLCMVSLLAVVCALAVSFGMFYNSAWHQTKKEVRHQAEYISAVPNLDTTILKSLAQSSENRLTLVAPSGEVLFDSFANTVSMGNHADRPEILLAMEHGVGDDTRKSKTMDESTYYYAVRLDNGNVLRVAVLAKNFFGILKENAVAITVALVSIFAVAAMVARSLTNQITEPINKLNLDDPLNNETYEEILPLLSRMQCQNEEAARNGKMRQEFSANVSHELKTPLTSIMGYAEIVENGIAKPEDVPRFAEQIRREANHLLEMIEDIIRLSHLDEADLTAEFQQIDLQQLCHEVAKNLQPKAEKMQVTFTTDLQHCTVSGVSTMLYEMVYNLCDNAIIYNRVGGSVKLELFDDGKNVQLWVNDTGIGIAEENQQRIFERFYRVDASHSKQTGGTGLGLSIVKHTALLHNAKLVVRSRLGSGTRISVKFPQKDAQKSNIF